MPENAIFLNCTGSHGAINRSICQFCVVTQGRRVVKRAEDFQKYRLFLLRMAKICVTEELTAFLLAKDRKRVYNIK